MRSDQGAIVVHISASITFWVMVDSLCLVHLSELTERFARIHLFRKAGDRSLVGKFETRQVLEDEPVHFNGFNLVENECVSCFCQLREVEASQNARLLTMEIWRWGTRAQISQGRIDRMGNPG